MNIKNKEEDGDENGKSSKYSAKVTSAADEVELAKSCFPALCANATHYHKRTKLEEKKTLEELMIFIHKFWPISDLKVNDIW